MLRVNITPSFYFSLVITPIPLLLLQFAHVLIKLLKKTNLSYRISTLQYVRRFVSSKSISLLWLSRKWIISVVKGRSIVTFFLLLKLFLILHLSKPTHISIVSRQLKSGNFGTNAFATILTMQCRQLASLLMVFLSSLIVTMSLIHAEPVFKLSKSRILILILL